MGLILDTCIIIAAEKQKLSFNGLAEYGQTYITSITASELLVGVHRADSEDRRTKRAAFVEYILSNITALPFTLECARIHADIYASLLRRGEVIGAHDLLIAAIAITHGYPVLTINSREFQKVSGLEVKVP